MALLKELFDVWKKEHQQHCYNRDRMKNGGLILWKAVAICEVSKTSWQMGLLFKDDLENYPKGQQFLLVHLIEYHPISARDQSRLHQFDRKVLPLILLGCALIAGENLERRHTDCGYWGMGKHGRVRNPSSKNKRKGSINATKEENFIFVAGWCSKLSGRDHEFRTILRLLRRYWADLQSELFDVKVPCSKHPHWSVWCLCYSSFFFFSEFHDTKHWYSWTLDDLCLWIVPPIWVAVESHFPSSVYGRVPHHSGCPDSSNCSTIMLAVSCHFLSRSVDWFSIPLLFASKSKKCPVPLREFSSRNSWFVRNLKYIVLNFLFLSKSNITEHRHEDDSIFKIFRFNICVLASLSGIFGGFPMTQVLWTHSTWTQSVK